MNNNVTMVPLTDIDVESEQADKFLFTYNRDIKKLAESITGVGLINPVILVKGFCDGGKYSVVCGSLRVKALVESGSKEVCANVLDSTDEEELMLLSFQDNMFTREFNDIEKAITIKKFTNSGYDLDKLQSTILPHIGVAPNRIVMDKYLSLLNLEDEIKKSVANREIEMEKALALTRLDRTDRGFVYDLLFKESNINLNETKEVIKNLLDLKQIKQVEITELMTSDDITGLVSDKKLNKRQRGERICKLIKYKRYPTICAQEDKFENACKDLGLDSNVKINHSRYFEGNDIQIIIKTSEEKKLKESLDKLSSNIDNGNFKQLLHISRCSDMIGDINK